MRFHTPRNLGWKLGSLSAAILLWVAMVTEPEVVTTHAAPVLYKNLRPDSLVAGDAPDVVRVELRGTSGVLTPSNLDGVAVTFDLAAANGLGEHTLTIAAADLNLPRGVTFLRAAPSQLQINLARMATRQITVTPQFAGKLPDGYRMVSSSASPPSLPVVGAYDRVAAIAEVKTEPVNLAALAPDPAGKLLEFHVNAYVADPQLHFASSPAVTVSVVAEPILSGRNSLLETQSNHDK